MKTLVDRLREEADDTHKNWYRVASEEQRELCRALTIEAADRIAYLEGALKVIAEGTICPDLFPNDTDENVIAAKTAMVTAIAALEHSESETTGEV
jgi:hypothetical protein